MKRYRSPLRWPGNKFSLLPYIIPIVNSVKFKNYHEPFVGSGTVFLNIDMQHSNIYLSDANDQLINFYQQIRNNPNGLIEKLAAKFNNDDFFYKEREKIYKSKVEQAAQFYYLNRTCFSGIYRVNSKGQFNVPFGKRNNFELVDVDSIYRLHHKLKRATVICQDFNQSIKHIKKNDLVYLDPPYSSKTTDKTFLMYNENLFRWEDQIKLESFCDKIIKKGAFVILSNLYNEDIKKLFHKKLGLKLIVIERYSSVSTNITSRGLIKEMLFTNIDV